jgi:predicted MFS family arabinose efflux permease
VLPELDGTEANGFSMALARRLATRRLIAVYVVTGALVIGHFAAYTYLAPLARAHGDITGSAYGVLLLGYGAAGLVATVALGRIVDNRPRLSFAIPVATVAVAAFAIGANGNVAAVTVVAVVAWGGALVSVPAMLQAAVLRVAADADVASSVYVVAFQIGIGGGAGLGGILVDSGRLDTTTLVACAGAVLALVVGLASRGVFPAEGHPEVAERE